MDFLKKLIENKELTELNEAVKLDDFPTHYSKTVGDFNLKLDGIYQDHQGWVRDVYVSVKSPDGRKFKFDIPLVKPFTDRSGASHAAFNGNEAVFDAGSDVTDDDDPNEIELFNMMLNMILGFLDEVFLEAMDEAFDNSDAIANPKRRGWNSYPRQPNSDDYDY